MADVNLTSEQVAEQTVAVLKQQIDSLVYEVSVQRAVNQALTQQVHEQEHQIAALETRITEGIEAEADRLAEASA